MQRQKRNNLFFESEFKNNIWQGPKHIVFISLQISYKHLVPCGYNKVHNIYINILSPKGQPTKKQREEKIIS